MNPYIKLNKRLDISEESCRLRIWVSEVTNNIPPELFMYQWIPLIPLQEVALNSMFVAVCTYADLNSLPARVPTDTQHPFFRKRSVDLTFTTPSEAEYYWTTISGMVKQAVEDFSRNNSLPPAEVLEVSL